MRAEDQFGKIIDFKKGDIIVDVSDSAGVIKDVIKVKNSYSKKGYSIFLKVYFFSGSYKSDDIETIPSYVARKVKVRIV